MCAAAIMNVIKIWYNISVVLKKLGKVVFSMQTISLKSNSPDIIIPLLRHAIEREKRIFMESLRVTREKIGRLSKTLDVDIDKLMKGEIKHTEANEMQFIELEGEIAIVKHLESELKELESVEICK